MTPLDPKIVRQNFMRFIAQRSQSFHNSYRHSEAIKDLQDKSNPNAITYVLEDIYRKQLKKQESDFQDLLKIINEYFINEGKHWENISV